MKNVIGGLVMVVMAGLTAADVSAGSSAVVSIEDFKFTPPVLTVQAGTRVTWTNHDEEPHTITSAKGVFGSSGLSHDERFSQAFLRPGRYEYFCALHPHMKATVIVR
jgi:plastocyanin